MPPLSSRGDPGNVVISFLFSLFSRRSHRSPSAIVLVQLRASHFFFIDEVKLQVQHIFVLTFRQLYDHPLRNGVTTRLAVTDTLRPCWYLSTCGKYVPDSIRTVHVVFPDGPIAGSDAPTTSETRATGVNASTGILLRNFITFEIDASGQELLIEVQHRHLVVFAEADDLERLSSRHTMKAG